MKDAYGRVITGINVYNCTVTNVKAQVLPPSDNRKSVILPSNSAQAISYSFSNQLVAGQGIIVPAGARPVILCDYDLGSDIVKPIFAIVGGANVTIDITETVYQSQGG